MMQLPTQWITFKLPGRPHGKQRPRKGKGGQMYTPEATREYEAQVADAGELARPAGWPMEAQYELSMRIVYPDRRVADMSNVLKAIEDGLQGVLWEDDRDIVRYTTIERHVVGSGEEGWVEVSVRAIPGLEVPGDVIETIRDHADDYEAIIEDWKEEL